MNSSKDPMRFGSFASYLLVFDQCGIQIKAGVRLKVSDPAEGAQTRWGRPPVGMLPVLSPLQQILAPSVVGKVIKGPDAVCHRAGMHLPQLVGLVHRRAIRGTVHHLSAKVRPLVQPQLPRISVYLWTKPHFSLDTSADIKQTEKFCDFVALYFNIESRNSPSLSIVGSTGTWVVLLHSWLRGRIWHCRWMPSTVGCLRTPLGSECTGSPCSWPSRRSPTGRSPPW